MCFGNAMCFMFHVFMVVYVKSLCVSPMLSVCPKQISLVRETIKYLLNYLLVLLETGDVHVCVYRSIHFLFPSRIYLFIAPWWECVRAWVCVWVCECLCTRATVSRATVMAVCLAMWSVCLGESSPGLSALASCALGLRRRTHFLPTDRKRRNRAGGGPERGCTGAMVNAL